VKQVDRTDSSGCNRSALITKALAGKEVGLLEVEHRILVFYRRTLICELDPMQPRSTMAPHRDACGPSVKDVRNVL